MVEVVERERPERVVIEVGPPAGWVCDLCGWTRATSAGRGELYLLD